MGIGTEVKEALKGLQKWRNQVVGMGLLPVDLKPLIDLLENGDIEIKKLNEQISSLHDEIKALSGKKAELDEKAADLLSAHNDKINKLSADSQKWADEERQWKSMAEQAKKDHDKTVAELSDHCKAIEKEKLKVQSDLASAKKEIENLKKRL